MGKIKRILLWVFVVLLAAVVLILLLALIGGADRGTWIYIVFFVACGLLIVRSLRKPASDRSGGDAGRRSSQGRGRPAASEAGDAYLDKCLAAARNLIRHAPRPAPDLGYYNMPMYTVIGINPETKRRNTRHIRARHPDDARRAGGAGGLVEPMTVEEEPFAAASGRSEYGYTIPDGACQDDAQELELCASQCDGEPIPAAFMSFLTDRGIPCSRIAGRNLAMERLLRTLSDDARAALFGFAVESALCSRLPEDVAEAFTAHRYEDFAAAAGRDAVVLKSIKDRPAADYWDPSKRSAAYKFAAEYFADRS